MHEVLAPIERHAIAAMRVATLRGMDALHVGTAQAARVDLFVTVGRRQGLKPELLEA